MTKKAAVVRLLLMPMEEFKKTFTFLFIDNEKLMVSGVSGWKIKQVVNIV